MKNIFKCRYKYKAELDMDSLLSQTKIKKYIFYSIFNFFGEHKFIGRRNKNNDLMLLYVQWWSGNIPVAVISKTDGKEYDIEIRYDNVTSAIWVFMFILFVLFFAVAIYVKSVEMILYLIVFGIIFILMRYFVFKIFSKRLIKELDDFVIKEK